MRDRLIELLKSAKLCSYRFDDQYSDGTIAKIADHLIANGVILPPCKVGDTVYYINTRPHIVLRQYEVYEAKVARMVITTFGLSLVLHIGGEFGCCECPDIDDWGKTVFLTKEDAEKALKEKNNAE